MRIGLLLRYATTLADWHVYSGDWVCSIAVNNALCVFVARRGASHVQRHSAQLQVRYTLLM